MVAGLMVDGSDVTIEGVGLNPTRTGLLDVLRAMRADVELTPKGEAAGGEPIGDVRVQHGAESTQEREQREEDAARSARIRARAQARKARRQGATR